MFSESMIESTSERKASKAWLTLPISLLFHGVVVIAAIVVPLLSAQSNLPEIKVTQVYITAPPQPPSVPPAPKSTPGKNRQAAAANPVPANNTNTTIFFAPTIPPTSIIQEEIGGLDWRNDNGVIGGADYGVPGGDPDGIWPELLSGIRENQVVEPLRVASVQRPRLIRRIEPNYPQIALKSRIQGTVVIEAVTDIYGRVKGTRIITGNPLLNQAALDAVKQWLYEPYVIDGIPKPVTFTVNITFTLKE